MTLSVVCVLDVSHVQLLEKCCVPDQGHYELSVITFHNKKKNINIAQSVEPQISRLKAVGLNLDLDGLHHDSMLNQTYLDCSLKSS